MNQNLILQIKHSCHNQLLGFMSSLDFNPKYGSCSDFDPTDSIGASPTDIW